MIASLTGKWGVFRAGLLSLGLLNDYIEKRGLPEYLRFGEKSHLQMLYESILFRDIIARYRLTTEHAIKKLVLYLASNVGKEFSYSEVARSIGISSPTTVSEYYCYLIIYHRDHRGKNKLNATSRHS